MTSNEILDILKTSNALLEGHFILTSGLHSPQYVEKFRLLENPRYTEQLCKQMAQLFKDKNVSIVIGPMTGGIILSYEIGKQLGTNAIFTERIEGKMTLRRGFTLSADDRVLIVEDIITTGGSIDEVIEVVEKNGAKIIGITCILDRSNGKAQFKYPFKPLMKMDVVTYKPDECPLCKKGVAAYKPGATSK